MRKREPAFEQGRAAAAGASFPTAARRPAARLPAVWPYALTRVRLQAVCGRVLRVSEWARGAQRLHGQVQPLLLPVSQFPLFIGADQGFNGEGMCSRAQGDCRSSPFTHLSRPHPGPRSPPLLREQPAPSRSERPPGPARERRRLGGSSAPSPCALPSPPPPAGTGAPSCPCGYDRAPGAPPARCMSARVLLPTHPGRRSQAVQTGLHLFFILALSSLSLSLLPLPLPL